MNEKASVPEEQMGARRVIRRFALIYASFLAIGLLMPFHLILDGALFARKLAQIGSLWPCSSIFEVAAAADFLQNVVLFLPLGFLLRAAGLGVLVAAAVSLGASCAVEVLQALMPGRVPSIYDIAANTAGGAAGAAVARLFEGRVERFSARLLAIRLSPRLAAGLAAAELGAVLVLLFLPAVPAVLGPWNDRFPLHVSGLPGDRGFWRGTLHRLAVWGSDVTAGGVDRAGDPERPPLLDLDFRGERPPAFLSPLPEGARWSPAGLSIGDRPVRLPDEFARALAKAPAGNEFSMALWVSPERFDGEQEGNVIALGSDFRNLDVRVKQDGRDVAVFFRTAASGRRWDRPQAEFRECLSEVRPQRWTFAFDGNELKGFIDGRPCERRFYLRWWTSPTGILLSSPLVFEKLTLFGALFLPYGILVGRILLGGARGALLFLVAGGGVPLLACAVLSALHGVPIDRLLPFGIALGIGLGGLVGDAWRRAPVGASPEGVAP